MKKFLKLAVCFVLCLTVLVGCGSKKAAIIGEWKAVSMTSGGEEMNLKDMGMGDMITLTAKEDNTFELKMSAFGQSETIKGKWKENGDKYILTADGEEENVDATVKDGKLKFVEDGSEMIFEKK